MVGLGFSACGLINCYKFTGHTFNKCYHFLKYFIRGISLETRALKFHSDDPRFLAKLAYLTLFFPEKPLKAHYLGTVMPLTEEHCTDGSSAPGPAVKKTPVNFVIIRSNRGS